MYILYSTEMNRHQEKPNNFGKMRNFIRKKSPWSELEGMNNFKVRKESKYMLKTMSEVIICLPKDHRIIL